MPWLVHTMKKQEHWPTMENMEVSTTDFKHDLLRNKQYIGTIKLVANMKLVSIEIFTDNLCLLTYSYRSMHKHNTRCQLLFSNQTGMFL